MPHVRDNSLMVTEQSLFTHEIGSTGRRPRVALVTSLTGQEFNARFVLLRLADYLRSVVDGAYPGQQLTARVLIVAGSASDDAADRCAVPHAIAARRNFNPGKAGPVKNALDVGEIIEATRAAYYRVELGASSSELEELPQVCLHQCSDDERATAFLFGLPAIIEYPNQTLAADTLATAWQTLGGENFVIRAGQAGSLQPQHCERLFRALVSFLDRTSILEGIDLSEEEDHIHHFGVHQTLPMLAEAGGFFVSRLEVGRWMRAGESLGAVYDRSTGIHTADIKAPNNGLVSALRRHPLLKEGDVVAKIQTQEMLPLGFAQRESLSKE